MFAINKEDPSKYNEVNDKYSLRDFNDPHKNILLRISEMTKELNMVDKLKANYIKK